ncbi:ABC transporter substrate-binding protein [Aggregicoccus sp. 17bor-14]|uniref:ABC transporter substrate-binding protein n=1 Tax=Myxococcaceae TaxID=31 RepID=UPI0012F0EFDC|nr:ABC transporter substrate-binding protein [Aggregicoccus sp. 17bor-14]
MTRRLGWVGLCAVLLAAGSGCRKGASEAPDAGAPDAGPAALNEQEPNDRPEQALSISGDAVVTAGLAADPSRADEDWYRLAPGSPRVADVSVSGIPGSDVTLGVFDRDRNPLVTVNGGGEGQGEHLPNLYVDGERWVRVAAARKGAGGAYRLQVSFRAPGDGEEREPNDRAADATPLLLGQAVAAYIGHAADEDWYRLELQPGAGDAGSGEPAAPAPAPAEATADAGGAAEANAPPAPAAPDPDEEARRAEEAAAQAAQAGGAAAVVLPGATPPPPPEPPGIALRIDLSAVPGVRPELTLLSAAEAPLFTTRGQEGQPLSLRNIGVRANDQVVYLVVKSAWSGTGKEAKRGANTDTPYTLSVTREPAGANAELEPNDALAKATPVQLPGPTGTAYKEGFLSPKGDVDTFVLHTQEPLRVRAELSGVERLDLMLSVVEPPATEGGSETVTLRANDGALKEPERLNDVTCQGACYFRVEGAPRKVEGKWVKDYENAEVPYRLTLTAAPDDGSYEREPNNTPERATPITIGKPLRGTVFPKKDTDFYRLDLSDRPVRTSLKVTLIGVLKVDVGLYLHRLGEDGKPQLVQTSDRAKGDAPESIRYSAEPGVYLLEVRDSKNRESNFQDPYQLSVEEEG